MAVSRSGLESRFLDLVENHQGIVHKVCSLYAETPDAREDLYQEILMQLWRSFPSFRGNSRFSTWMYRVALNTALLERRGRRRTLRPARLPQDVKASVGPRESGPDVEQLQHCIRQLRELDRAVILLYLEQHSHEEIADLTGLTRGSVGVRIVRIKQRLRECLLTPGRDKK